MKTEIFSSPSLYLVVYREEDGTLSWIGDYKGMKIDQVAVVGGRWPWSGTQCIILINYMERRQARLSNLLCVGRDGNTRWVADLPGSPDSFVGMHMEGNVLSAGTWTGYGVKIDPKTGKRLSMVFVK